MPDYKEMYLTLMRETEKAIRILVQAQQRCEELYCCDDDSDLQLFPFKTNACEKTDDPPRFP